MCTSALCMRCVCAHLYVRMSMRAFPYVWVHICVCLFVCVFSLADKKPNKHGEGWWVWNSSEHCLLLYTRGEGMLTFTFRMKSHFDWPSPHLPPLPLPPSNSLIVSSVHTKSSGSQQHVTSPDRVIWESQAFWLMEDHPSLITVLKITFWMEISAKRTLFFDVWTGAL